LLLPCRIFSFCARFPAFFLPPYQAQNDGQFKRKMTGNFPVRGWPTVRDFRTVGSGI